MLDALTSPVLLAIFIAAAGAVWAAGIKLSDATDILEARFGLGQALGGMILLAIATNLPEIAITVSASLSGRIGIATGNIFGGIAIQTLVLVVLDAVCLKGRAPLTFQAASLTLVLEGILLVAVLVVAIMGTRLPADLVFARLAPGETLILALWCFSLWLVNRARSGLPWHATGDAPGGQERSGNKSSLGDETAHRKPNMSTSRAAVLFTLAALVTLGAGVALEVSSETIASRIGMSGVLFGATVLAAATALPEVSTGLTAVRLGDYQLAISDIFGGNAVLPVILVLAPLISGKPALPQAQNTDIYLAGLGILLTCVYLCGLIFRPRKKVFHMGLDSLAVLILYLAGIAGLTIVTFTQSGP